MKAISCLTVSFRRAVVFNAARRTFAKNVKDSSADKTDQPATDLLNSVKPHARSGVLSAVERDENGFPSYIILKETSPLLRSVSKLLNIYAKDVLILYHFHKHPPS